MGGRNRLSTRMAKAGADLSGHIALGATGVGCMAGMLEAARAEEIRRMRSFTGMTERELKAALVLELNTQHAIRYRANLAKRKLRELIEQVDASKISYETRIIDDDGVTLTARADAIGNALPGPYKYQQRQ